MHCSLQKEAQAYADDKARRVADARQMVAFRLATGIDLDAAMAADEQARAAIAARLQRLIERERLRGARRHWSYDLNRHIALAQALGVLRGSPCGSTHLNSHIRTRRAARKSGA